jgi:hypothetical protein
MVDVGPHDRSYLDDHLMAKFPDPYPVRNKSDSAQICHLCPGVGARASSRSPLLRGPPLAYSLRLSRSGVRALATSRSAHVFECHLVCRPSRSFPR